MHSKVCNCVVCVKAYLDGFFMFSIHSGTSHPELCIRPAILY